MREAPVLENASGDGGRRARRFRRRPRPRILEQPFLETRGRRDVEIDRGEVVEEDAGGRAALKPCQRLHVAATPPARVDDRVRAPILRHELDELLMVGGATVGAVETLRFPLRATAAAAQI